MAQTLNTPQVLNQPIANNGDKNVIPNTNDQSTGLMSMSAGFPPVTSQRIADGGIPPRRSDVNGALNLISQQHYFLQNGGTYTFRQDVSNAIGGYPKNAILYYEDADGNLTLVRSLVENNTNNFVNDPSLIDNVNWERLSLGIANANIGQIIQVACAPDYTPFGTLPCDGSQYSSSKFPTLWQNYLTVDTPLLNTCTFEEWESEVTSNGQCLKFAVDTTNNVFKVPLIKDRTHLQQALTDDELSKFYSDGLPALDLRTVGAHTHTRGTMNITGGPIHINAYGPGNITSGAFTTVATGPSHNDSGGTGVDISFNAANAWTGATSSNGNHTHTFTSSKVGKYNTVQPVSFGIRFFVVVANAVRNESMMDWSQWQTDLQNRANIDLSNLSALGEKHFLNYNQVTNCLTEIPQDINLELVGSTLIAEQGSKVWIPHGTTEAYNVGDIDIHGHTVVATSWDGSNFFYAIELGSDIVCESYQTAGNRLMMYNNNNVYGGVIDFVYSGDTSIMNSKTPYVYAYFYNTQTNKMYRGNGSSWGEGLFSLPLGMATGNSSSQYTSLDQTFNGFGYIGSTIYTLPGIKGLMPNGRNADGTLNNIEITTTKVTTMTNPFGATSNANSVMALVTNGTVNVMHRYIESTTAPTTAYTSWYNPITNIILYAGSTAGVWSEQPSMPVASLDWTYVASPRTNTFTSLVPKLPFRAVDRNDSSWLSGLGMPSDKYISLTPGASGASYVAPVNGYFTFSIKSSSTNTAYYSGAIIPSNSEVALLRSHGWIPSNTTNNNARGFLPCKKGQRLFLGYYNSTIDLLQFTYAEGEIE